MFLTDKILRRTTTEESRYSALLWSLIVLFALYPIMDGFGLSRFWSLVFVVELLLAVVAISKGGRPSKIAALLVAPAVLGELLFFLVGSRETHWFSVLSVGLFLVYVIAVVYRRSVFSGERVTPDRVSGAIAVYLLVGLLWAVVYGVVGATNPDAFKGLEPFALDKPGAQHDYLYFSFVTLTTLGYGDMSPVSSVAKTLAWFEAVFGQLYLAVTIARLVSLEVSYRESSKHKARDRSDTV